MLKVALTLCVVIAMACTDAEALKCYQCDSCSTVTDSQLKTCPALLTPTQCTKTTLSGTVSRDCGVTGFPTSCISLGGTETCICNGDGCNGAGHVYAGTMVALLVSSVTGYLLQ